jgi:hypothetical protein
VKASYSTPRVPCPAGPSSAAQVAQAHAEAREAEAAAEQRLAAALALERAELDKQVQLSPSVQQCGSAALLWLGCSEGACARRRLSWLHTPCRCDSMGHKEADFSRSEGELCLSNMPC